MGKAPGRQSDFGEAPFAMLTSAPPTICFVPLMRDLHVFKILPGTF